MHILLPFLKTRGLNEKTFCPQVFHIDQTLTEDWEHFCMAGQHHQKFEEFFEFYQENGNLFAKMSSTKSTLDLVLGNYAFKLS